MATPHVAGVAGLLLAQDPDYTLAELRWRLLSGVDPVLDLAGKTATGGRLNAFNTLTLPQPEDTGIDIAVVPTGPSGVSPGDTVDFSTLLTNDSGAPVPVISLVYVKQPSGRSVLLLRPFPYIGVLEAGAQIARDGFYQVPSDAAPGLYRILSLVAGAAFLEEERIFFEVEP
jgi:hypothetical protein